MSCNYFIIEKAVVHEILFSLSGKGGVLLMAGPRRALAVWRPGIYGAHRGVRPGGLGFSF